MKIKDIKEKYGVRNHASTKELYSLLAAKGFDKPFQDCTDEEIIKEYSEKCSKKPTEQLELFPKNEKKAKAFCKKIGKYKANVSVLTFQPPKELKNQFISNCVEFGIDYGKILTRIFAECKWNTWNNKEWLEKFSKGE